MLILCRLCAGFLTLCWLYAASVFSAKYVTEDDQLVSSPRFTGTTPEGWQGSREEEARIVGQDILDQATAW